MLQRVGRYMPYIWVPVTQEVGLYCLPGFSNQPDPPVLEEKNCCTEKLRDNANIDIASWWHKGLALGPPDFVFIFLPMTHCFFVCLFVFLLMGRHLHLEHSSHFGDSLYIVQGV